MGVIPRGVVATMAQDKTGFLWLATGDGLVRFDGYRYRPQEFDSPDPAQRNLGWIRALLPSRDGRLWIGTETRGLAVYDPTADAVTFPLQPDDGAATDRSLVQATVRALAEGPNGAIWAGTMGGGLQALDPVTSTMTTYRHDPARGSLPDDRVLALLVDRAGNLWVGTWLGLSLKRQGSEVFEPVAPGPGAPAEFIVQALMEASDGHIWLGTQGGEVGRIDRQSGSLALMTPQGGGAGSHSGSVSSLVELPGGKVWVGRSTGIDVHELRSGERIQSLRHDPGSTRGLAANEVTALVRDRAGWIWIAGFGLGLQRHDPNNTSLWVRGMDTDMSSPMARPDVRGVVQLDTGEIWAATQTAGVAILNSAFATVTRLGPSIAGADSAAAPVQPPREFPSVNAITQASDGTIWMASDGWLYQYDRDRRQLNALVLNAGVTHRLVPGEEGTVWVCTQNGLYRLDPAGPSLQAIRDEDGSPFVGDVFSVAHGPDQALWVGTVKGLYRLQPHQSSLEAVKTAKGVGLGNPIVIGLLWDAENTLWLDTAVTGLHQMVSWDGETARFDRISERHGIVSRPFGANLQQDARGRIWPSCMSTTRPRTG